MAKVTYKPGPNDPQTVQWAGKTFEAGKAQEIEDSAALLKAKTNPFFEVSATKEEQRQAELVGGYADANTGDEIALVRIPRTRAYGAAATGPTGPVPPSPATQGSAAVDAVSTTLPGSNAFEQVYGAPEDEFHSGEAEVSAEFVGPEGTEGVEGKPAKRGRK